ncbi:hypothetical protein LBMAG52_41260 [Planctomycetia bacterium]|nr:hypothetical protein LBMAG52_41260 [Planctomycetia bacterium]
MLAACDVNEGTRVIAVRFEVSSGSQKFKCAASREAIEAAGSELHYLPPYSPDLSPIELAFSKLKKLLRDGAERTVDKLWTLCGKALDEFNEHECRNYFKHCGYRYT